MSSARRGYDVVVVGAGSVGTPSALALAERGLRVLVLERRAAAGQGDNKAAIGGVRATHSDPAKILLCTESLRIFSTWRAERGDDIGFKPGGYAFPVYGAALQDKLRGLLPLQHSYALDIDWVDAARMATLIPGIDPDGLRGGTYSPGDGQVSPLLAVAAFQRAAQAAGAEFRFREPVVGFEQRGGRVTAVRTERATYATDAVVLATGADAAAQGPALGVTLPVYPDSHEAGISAPLAPFLAPLVVDLRPGPLGRTANFYFGQNGEGQIIFCYTPSSLFPGTERASTSEFLPVVARRLIGLLPRLKNMLVRRIWRGCYPMTPDGIPIVDRLSAVEGVTLAIGMCGQGFMLGPGVAAEVAHLVCEGRTGLPPEAHASLRFDRSMATHTETLK